MFGRSKPIVFDPYGRRRRGLRVPRWLVLLLLGGALGAGGKHLPGVMQFVVAGANSRGPDTSIPLKPFAISVGSHESLRGDVPLPDGFSPRETTIKVLDRPDGKLLGMRVMHVQ